MAKTQIVDIVRSIIENLNFTINITSNVIDGNGNNVLGTTNTYYLTKNKGVVIDGKNYIVVSFVFNVSVTVRSEGHNTPITTDSFELPAPLFFHGTIISTEREVLATMEKEPDAYPIAYLYENIKETNFANKTNQIKREAPIQLFFVDIYNPENDYNTTILEDVTKPLSNLEDQFYKEISKGRNHIGKITKDWKSGNITRFAISNFQGETKRIFNEYLSSVEIDITLPIKKC